MSISEKPNDTDGISSDAIEHQLARILGSAVFAAAPRMRRLLAFLVRETLAGNLAQLNQLTLGIDVFEQDSTSFDPRRNPIVRVQVSKLRHELQRYYGVKPNDPIHIEIPPGQYRPVFKDRISGEGSARLEESLSVAEPPRGPVASNAWSESGRSPPPTRYPTLAVAPLCTLGRTPELVYFSDGLREDLIAALTKFSYLRVIGLDLSFEPTAQALEASGGNRAPGPRYVLEGSVRQVLDTIRVALRLVDTASGVNYWSRVYDRSLTSANILEVQDELTTRIVTTIAAPYGIIPHLDMRHASWGREPDRLAAYDYLLWTFAYWRHLASDDHRLLREGLEQRGESSPDCASLWAVLALLYLDEVRFGLNPRPSLYDPLERALAFAQRAVALEPNNALAHQAVLNACFHTGALAQSQTVGERALALNVYNTDFMAELGTSLSLVGKWDQGIPLLRRATTLSPGLPGWKVVALFCEALYRGDYAAALSEAAAIGMPGWYWSHAFSSVAHGLLGQSALARAELEKLLTLNPGFPEHARQHYRQLGLPRELFTKFVEGWDRAGLRIVAWH